MKLRNVLLDRAGQRVPLRLEDLAGGLNVVFGPLGSGKTTLVRSIVAGLFPRHADSPLAQLELYEGRANTTWEGPPHHTGPTEAEYRQVFCWQVGGTPWQTLWRFAESRGWTDSRSWGLASSPASDRSGSPSDLEWRIRDCRERLANLPTFPHNVAELTAERRSWEARLLDLRETRTREWERRDREIRTARLEREGLESRINRLQAILDRIDQRRERRLALAEQAWHYDLRNPVRSNDGSRLADRYQPSRLGGVPGGAESLARWEQIHRRLMDEIHFLESVLREIPNSFNRNLPPHSDRLAFLLRSLDVEVRDWEAATRGDVTPGYFGSHDIGFDERTAWNPSAATPTVRNCRALIDEMLTSLRDNLTPIYPTSDEHGTWRDPHGIRLALGYLQRSADALQELIEQAQVRHDPVVTRGYYGDEAWYRENPVREWRHAARSPRASLGTVRQLHLAAAERLAERRTRISLLLDRKRQDLHQLRDWNDVSWKTSLDEEMETCQHRVAQIERELNRLDERNRLVRTLEQLEREWHELRATRSMGNVAAEASRILQQLTRGLFRSLVGDGRGELCLESGGQHRELHTLRGVEHEVVSLSLQLALVGMFLRHGWEMPLLIDELPEGTLFDKRELARILSDLAHGGQQIIVFTADPAWLREFEGKLVNVYTLVRRTVTERIDSRVRHDDQVSQPSGPNRAHAASTWPWPRRGDEKPTTIPFADSQTLSAPGPLRFYLQRQDDVVDAPSIGPKTADRLYRFGVRTVRDLLSSDPIGSAHQFAHRHVTADVIRDWQDQARLVCCIPHLRGHDSQLLVACRVRDPQELARQDAPTLWREVDRFADSVEGRRILRNGKKPSLSAVQDWIRWARDARSLEAA